MDGLELLVQVQGRVLGRQLVQLGAEQELAGLAGGVAKTLPAVGESDVMRALEEHVRSAAPMVKLAADENAAWVSMDKLTTRAAVALL